MKTNLCSILFFTLFLILTLCPPPCIAQDYITGPTLSFSPSPVQSPAVGEQLTLDLNIASGENVAGYQVTVQFDATALRYVSSANADYLPAGAFAVPAVATSNTVTLAATSLAGESNGNGTLATLTFQVVAAKASVLTLSEVLLSDSNGQSFRPEVESGEITAPTVPVVTTTPVVTTDDPTAAGPTLSFSPSPVQSPAVGEQLTLDLNIANGENVAGYQVTVQFDATALRYVSSANADYLPAGAFAVPAVATGNTVTLAATSLAGESNGNGTLATLTFQVVAAKASVLTLSETLLSDSEGGISRPEVESGEITAPTVPVVTTTPVVTTDDPTAVGPTLSFSPSPVQSPAVGEQLTLNLNIANGENVAGYQVTVQFDTTALRYVSSANADYLPVGAFAVPAVATGNTVTLAATSLAGESNGNGTLATLTFQVVAAKASVLTLSEVLLSDSEGGGISRLQVESGEITTSEAVSVEADDTYPTWDVNEDGQTNIADLLLVLAGYKKTPILNQRADVNGDGVVDKQDIIIVATHLGESTNPAAPNNVALPENLTPGTLRPVLNLLRSQSDGSLAFQRAIEYLEHLLASLIPQETVLLANYPNPFNPETWIPYQLAKSVDVTVHIYGINGTLVRTLFLGHQAAGTYHNRSRAAYWDGKNEIGEPVASGIYFYTLTAGDYVATRKMLIRK